MKKVSLRIRSFDKERFLTYNIDNEACLDEEVIDFIEDEEPSGVVPVIFEEGEDFDTFSYSVTDRIHLSELSNQEVGAEMVLKVLRSLVLTLINMTECRIPLSYLVLHRDYIYVDSDYKIAFICIPIEDMQEDVDLNAFLRGYLANIRYDISEDCTYVAKLLTYVNNTVGFNLHNMVSLIEELMEDMGIEIPEEDSAEIYADYQEIMEEAEDLKEGANQDDADIRASQEAASMEFSFETSGKEETSSNAESEKTKKSDTDTSADLEEPIEQAEDYKETFGFSMEKPEEKEENLEEQEEESIKKNAFSLKEEEIPLSDVLEEELPEEEDIVSEDVAEETAPESEETEEPEESKEKVTQKPIFKTKDTSVTGVVIEDDLDEFLAEKEREDQMAPHEESNLKIKKNIKVNRASIVKNTQDELMAEEKEEKELQNEEEPKVEEKAEEEEEEAVSTSILSQTLGVTGILKGANVPKANPYLIRTNTKERVMITKQNFKIGKANMGVDYTVKGNGAVSRTHAVITNKDGVYYIKDNKSTNHTYVNNKMVEDGESELLTHDCKIVLGDEEFTFKLR